MRCLERWYSRNIVALSGAHVEVVFGFTSQNYGSVGTLLSTKNAGVKGNQITQPMIWNGQEFTNLGANMPFFINEVKSFAVLFTAASVKNYSIFELPKADFAIIDLLFNMKPFIRQQLNLFFDGLKTQVAAE